MKMARKNVTSAFAVAGLGAALALAALPGGADGQAPDTQGLQPFLGCWQADGAEEELGILCFAEISDRVEMLTIADGAITHREPFQADGRTRQIEQDGCVGTESARFSDDQRRIYTASEVACQGQEARSGTGVIFMASASEWVDVRSSHVRGEEASAWVQWYVRTSESPLNELGIRSGRTTPTTPFRGMAPLSMSPITIDDVIDASENVDAKAVEAWIAEVDQGFAGLNSKDLLKLDAAGVTGDVIDIVVAVSFPERFAVSEGGARGQAGYGGMRPLWADPYYYNGYGRYGYGGWYSPYPYYGGYGRYYPYRTVVVDVTPVPRYSGGRVIAGRGYSQGSAPSAGTVPGRTGSSVGSSASGRSSTVGSSSSGGSSRSSTGRTAKRRGGKSG